MSLGEVSTAVPGENGGSTIATLGLANTLTIAPTEEAMAHVQDVLSSEIGISAMLNRLKQSIAAAKEFALFLKKRALLEEDHASGLKKLCRMSQDNMQRPEHRGGSFAKAWEDMMTIHERMADNGQQFAMSLIQMNEDLLELAAVAEKARKGWKQNGLVAEQKVVELETAMRKAKAKYDSLAEEYDRARTGDTSGRQGGKMFGIRGPKSAHQHEEDVYRKAQAADQDYMNKVQLAQAGRTELLSKTRPETVQALQETVRECDAGVVLQMQKFASFNEKLLLSNGLSISPLKSTPESRSLRECILAIDNDGDLHDYLNGYYSRMPPRGGEPKYERNPLLDQTNRALANPYGQSQQVLPPIQPSQPQLFGGPGSRSSTFVDTPISPQVQTPAMGHHYGQSTSSIAMLGQRPGSQPQHERTFSHGSILSGGPGNQQPFGGPRGPAPPQSQPAPSRFNGDFSPATSQGPPQLGALPFQPAPQQQQQQPPPSQPAQITYTQPPVQQGPPPNLNLLGQNPQSASGLPSNPTQNRGGTPPTVSQIASSRPVFGVSLSTLYERDGLAVPMVVYQCIQAVDLFGLGVEGIYRLSGSLPHVNKLKNLFDTDSTSANLDFRNPENFFHDVNSVAGLLKQFFRDLPDPLLTKEHYSAFIEAAKNEDDVVRRDSLHAIINSLPDPNYATLRALTLHLYRVMDNAGTNRMSSQNLAIVFGPTLMGSAPGTDISDAGWRVRVVDTILQNTYQIFDDDD